MADPIRNVGGGPPLKRPDGPRPPTTSSGKEKRPESAPKAERISGRKQLAEDTIEISSQGKDELQHLQASRAQNERLDQNDLEFTGRRFYTIGLNIIREERIQPPSEPDVKE